MILPATDAHIPQVVAIHCASLPGDFLPQLGMPFLQKTFYPAVIASNQAKLFIDKDQNGDVAGFIIVTLDSGKFLAKVIKDHFWSFAATGIRSSLRSIKQFKKNIEILSTSLFLKDAHPAGEIYIIAVDERLRGKGVGARLVSAAADYLRQKGIPALKIKTLTSNVKWIGYFKKSGWMVVDQYTLIGNNYTVLQTKL